MFLNPSLFIIFLIYNEKMEIWTSDSRKLL